jgi:hypothetical protein
MARLPVMEWLVTEARNPVGTRGGEGRTLHTRARVSYVSWVTSTLHPNWPRPMSRPPYRVSVLALLALALAACSASPETEVEPDPRTPPDPVPAEARADVEARGGAAAGALAQGLVGRLTAAIDDRGVAGAVDFCATEAMDLTREIIVAHDPALEIKRASTRWRNPENAPDPEEARVLAYLESLEQAEPGSAPETFTAMGPVGTYRFYRTLRTAPMCLRCHGSVEEMDPQVREILRERYPDDRATGYSEGDFRGVIRVQMPGSDRSP